jgi:hypothetical protein
MISKKYKEEARNYIKIMSEAIEKDDIKVFDAAKSMLEETIDECKKEHSLSGELNTTNFGVLNHIFEECLPNLMKTNKPAVKKVIKLMKEDKTLKEEFNFYNTIRNYNSSISDTLSPSEMMEKLNESILSKIDHEKVEESNRKLRDTMKSANIIPESHVTGEKRNLYECGDVLLTTKPSAMNIIRLHENQNGIIEYLDVHKNDAAKKTVTPDVMIEEFENKLKDTLNESEISFVQTITDFRTPIAEQRREKLFNNLKNECIKMIDEMLSKDGDNIEIKGLKEQLESMKYTKEGIVRDVAKLLEIRDVLMDD